jgi:hypothetical protein
MKKSRKHYSPAEKVVLVQREMESGRSPLVSIARAAAGTRKQRTETAAGFKGNQGGPQ